MNIITKPKLALLLAILLAVPALVVLSPSLASAHDGESHGDTAQAEDREEEPEETEQHQEAATPLGTYTYVAQPGDSYTLLARKAVQTYGKKFDAKLSLAGIVFAETNLTQAAGSPQLAEGQQVEINEATVKEWADRALNLTDAEEAAWNYYVQFVDSFNTDAVGQPAS